MPKIHLPIDIVERLEAECRPEYDETVSDAIHALIVRYNRALTENNEALKPAVGKVELDDQIPQNLNDHSSSDESRGEDGVNEAVAGKESDLHESFPAGNQHTETSTGSRSRATTSSSHPRFQSPNRLNTKLSPVISQSFLPFCAPLVRADVLPRCTAFWDAENRRNNLSGISPEDYFKSSVKYRPPVCMESLRNKDFQSISLIGSSSADVFGENDVDNWKKLVEKAVQFAHAELLRRGERNPHAFIRVEDKDYICLPKIMDSACGERIIPGIRKTIGSTMTKASYAAGAVKSGWFLTRTGQVYWKSIITHGRLCFKNSSSLDSCLLAIAIIQEVLLMEPGVPAGIRLTATSIGKEPTNLSIRPLPSDALPSDPALCQIRRTGDVSVNLTY